MAAKILALLPSVPYPPEQLGKWSPVTSTLDWCEENYVVTSYAAEIINTTTNLLFLYLGAKGIRNCLNNGHDRVFLVSFIGFSLVGTGSFLFHASLKYPFQLVDELSMIYTTCLMCHSAFTQGKSKRFNTLLACSLAGLAIFVTLYYHYLQEPKFHQAVFTILTIVVLSRSFYIMEVNLRPRRRSGKEEVKLREELRDEDITRQMWAMIKVGLSIYLGASALWALDRNYCHYLIRWRRQVGLPWGTVLELHGWWHIGTGIGAYFYITWGIWLRHCLNNKQDEYKLDWPRFGVPVLVKKISSTAKQD
ncbi:alkaline ceramidase-like protein [Lophiostoma macrostomum CBS 122681]|uniref:Alkaline ceramidase-like protein n=1 Tax=Lophiostoma macrostomum CBS 122681 TaxID=1314788 RepID=A0A6A6T2J1_9PLEO|nr:alkaline ceramidase-like protein [Lophiostoma macrostomum CBS 122681]